MVMITAGVIFSPIIAILTGVLFLGLTRKIMARIHWRYGPPLLQPVIDMVKLFYQRSPSHGSTFNIGVVLSIAGSLVVLLFLPIGHLSALSSGGGLLVILYLMLIAPLGVALSGGEGANPYVSIGISRKLILSLGYEVTLILSVLAVMTHYDTISILDVVQAQAPGNWSLFAWPLFIPGISYLLILPAILGVRPFDVVSAPQEISTGPRAEYGGRYLALMTVEGAISEFIGIALFVNLFLGGWGLWGAVSSWASGPLAVFLGVMIFLVKVLVVYFLTVLVHAIFPRLRVEQAVSYLWKWPAVIALIGLIVVMIG